MAVLEVEFDGQIEDLQDQLDNADLEANVDVRGEAPAAGADDGEGGGGFPGRGSVIVGALTAIAGLLTPIIEILEGIRNFFLVTLAPVFSALRPLIDFLQDIIIGISRFLGGELSLNDIFDGIASSIDDAIGDIDFNISTPVGDFQVSTAGGERGRRTGTRTSGNQQGFEDDPLAGTLFDPRRGATGFIGRPLLNAFLPDRTDEAQTDRESNRTQNSERDRFGGDAGQ